MTSKSNLGNSLKHKGNIFNYYRIITALIFVFAISVPAFAQNNQITLSVRNATLKTVLSQIEKQSPYRFSFRDADIDNKADVSININNGTINAVLNQILQPKHLEYSITSNKIMITPVQNKKQEAIKTISGTVVDDQNEPVIGANVVIKGTTTGVITDADGKFSLKVPDNAILVVSYIGYNTQEISVKNKSVFTIQLTNDVKVLDEIVVVGFGSQKKVNLTGSVATVSSEVFEGRPVQNATMALQGTVPGLNISKGTGRLDQGPAINVRGMTTIGKGSNGDPLILIDGMEGDINRLNPQDIENVTVLKDAAAASIYGSRAPFGVILVTTKSGKKDKFTVNYNNSFRWSTPTKQPHVVDSYRFATYFNDAGINGKGTGKFTPERLQRIRDYMDGKITTVNIPDPNNPLVWADGYDYANANVDWYDEFYDKWNFAQEHTATVSGGMEKVQMYASFNYLGQDGMLKVNKDTYDRYATNLKVTSQLNEYLDVNYNMKYSKSRSERPYHIGNLDKLGYQTWPTLPVYDDKGYIYDAPSPMLDLREGGKTTTSNDALSQQLQVKIKPLKGWDIIGELNYAINRDRYHEDVQKTYNHNTAGDVIPNAKDSWVAENSYSGDYMNVNVYSTYATEFNNSHNLKVMIGFQSESKQNNKISASRNGISVPGMDVIDITNGTDGSGKTVPPGVGGYRDEWGVIGFFGRLNYDYKERYLMEVNVRHDGSSRFRANNRWKTFPSVSLGWNIAKEAFWEDFTSTISTLKARASYGVLGNQNTSSLYPTYITMPIGTANGGWIINGKKPNTASAPGLISSSLTWETVKSFNVGFDADLLQNRLNFSLDWYQRKTENMVGPAPELPVILGTGVPTTNNTDLKTKGWEISLKWRDRINKDLSYEAGFNLSDAQTVITSYPNETFNLGNYYPGQKVGEIWGYETIGIAKSQEEMDNYLATLPNGGQNAIGNQWEAGDIMYKDLNGDGKINSGSNTLNDHGDLKVIGNNTPRYRFGINLGLTWKNLDVSAFFQGVMKRDYWEGSWNFWGWNGELWRSTAYEEHMDYFRSDPEHYLGQNLDSYYPRPIENSSKNLKTQTRYLQNAAYIRLKNLQIGYALPRNVINKIKISNLRIFLSGENLWVGSNVKDMFDPEAMGYGNGSIGYPISRTFSTGVSITL